MKTIWIIIILLVLLFLYKNNEHFSNENKINENKLFLDFYESQIKKTNLIEENNNLFEKYYNKKKERCSWEKHSLKIRPKYEYTLDKNKNHIIAKNYFNKIVTDKLKLINFTSDGNLISAVRGRGYLNDERVDYGDDMDPIAFTTVPEEIIKNRSIKLLDDMFPVRKEKPKNKTEEDRDYKQKISVIYTIYRLIKDGKAIYTNFKNVIKKQDETKLYVSVNLFHTYCIKGDICEKTHKCGVDFIIMEKEHLEKYLKVYGPIRLCNIEGQDANCLEGSHKYLQHLYGPTYMIPLKVYEFDCWGGKKAPFLDEWNKEWSNTEFKKEHADPKFWEKKNQKYLKQKWTAKKF